MIAHASGTVEYVNERFVEITGISAADAIGENIQSIICDLSPGPLYDRIWTELCRGAEWHGDIPLKRRDGTIIWEAVAAVPIREGRGRPTGFVASSVDVTAQKESDQLRQILFDELDHRMKNVFASVLAVARHTTRNTTSREEFCAVFDARLRALADVHRLIYGKKKGAVMLSELVTAATRAYGDDSNVSVSGPDIAVPKTEAQAFYLAFHELASNAGKYGALSRPDGRIHVEWEIQHRNNGESLAIEWLESGVGGLRSPEQKGLGRALIEQVIGYQLHGETDLEFRESGLQCRIVVPLPQEVPVLQLMKANSYGTH